MKILFIDGTGGFYPSRIKEKPCGGILTSLSIIPKYLASRGHEVNVVSVWEQEETIDGVHYSRQRDRWEHPDIVIFNRNTISHPVVDCFPNSVKVLWLHDIVDPRYFDDASYGRMDHFIALSGYCRDSYSDFYEIPQDKFTVIPNGVDKSVWYADGRPRNPNLYMCASAPIKGLQPIDYLYSQMKRNNPAFELRLYCSQKLHDQEDEEKVTRMLGKLAEKGVTVCDPIPQQELAEVFREAYCLLMPSSYPEICSNVLLQAQACGLPVIASNIGSAAEFIDHGNNGLLTFTTPSDLFWWWKDFTMLAINLYLNPKQHQQISKASPLFLPSWDFIGNCWNNLLEDLRVQMSIRSVA